MNSYFQNYGNIAGNEETVKGIVGATRPSGGFTAKGKSQAARAQESTGKNACATQPFTWNSSKRTITRPPAVGRPKLNCGWKCENSIM